jgi:hypothetical protein
LNKTGSRDLLQWPQFHTEQLAQNWWSAGDYIGRIKITIAEGFTSAAQNALFVRTRNVVTFAFQHAPQAILEETKIAWPNEAMWLAVERNPYQTPTDESKSAKEDPRIFQKTADSSTATGSTLLWDNTSIVNDPFFDQASTSSKRDIEKSTSSYRDEQDEDMPLLPSIDTLYQSPDAQTHWFAQTPTDFVSPYMGIANSSNLSTLGDQQIFSHNSRDPLARPSAQETTNESPPPLDIHYDWHNRSPKKKQTQNNELNGNLNVHYDSHDKSPETVGSDRLTREVKKTSGEKRKRTGAQPGRHRKTTITTPSRIPRKQTPLKVTTDNLHNSEVITP